MTWVWLSLLPAVLPYIAYRMACVAHLREQALKMFERAEAQHSQVLADNDLGVYGTLGSRNGTREVLGSKFSSFEDLQAKAKRLYNDSPLYPVGPEWAWKLIQEGHQNPAKSKYLGAMPGRVWPTPEANAYLARLYGMDDNGRPLVTKQTWQESSGRIIDVGTDAWGN